MKRLLIPLVVALLLPAVHAQFGGRKDEAVIYLLTSKGRGDLRTAAPAANPGTGFEVINPAVVPVSVISNDFAAKKVRVLHREADDVFQWISQEERTSTPRASIQNIAKVFFFRGLLRDDNRGSVSQLPLDATGGLYIPYLPGVSSGPDVAIETSEYLFWTPKGNSLPFVQVPLQTPSSIGPAGLTGIELEAFSGAAPFFLPWTNLRRLYPNQGWPPGMDVKIIDVDPSTANTTQLLRLRPGTKTPRFSIPGNTHMFVLEGEVNITTAAGSSTLVKREWYSFLPANFSISISNPKTYQGPGQ